MSGIGTRKELHCVNCSPCLSRKYHYSWHQYHAGTRRVGVPLLSHAQADTVDEVDVPVVEEPEVLVELEPSSVVPESPTLPTPLFITPTLPAVTPNATDLENETLASNFTVAPEQLNVVAGPSGPLLPLAPPPGPNAPTEVAENAPSFEERLSNCTDVPPGRRHTCEQQVTSPLCHSDPHDSMSCLWADRQLIGVANDILQPYCIASGVALDKLHCCTT